MLDACHRYWGAAQPLVVMAAERAVLQSALSELLSMLAAPRGRGGGAKVGVV